MQENITKLLQSVKGPFSFVLYFYLLFKHNSEWMNYYFHLPQIFCCMKIFHLHRSLFLTYLIIFPGFREKRRNSHVSNYHLKLWQILQNKKKKYYKDSMFKTISPPHITMTHRSLKRLTRLRVWRAVLKVLKIPLKNMQINTTNLIIQISPALNWDTERRNTGWELCQCWGWEKNFQQIYVKIFWPKVTDCWSILKKYN